MNRSFRRILSAALISAATVSSNASADPLVTQWSFNLDSGFISWTATGAGATGSANNAFLSGTNATIPTATGGTVDFGTIGNVPTKLSWPSGLTPQSSLCVGCTNASPGNFSGTLNTNGAAVQTETLIHDNNVIAGGNSLSTATLFDLLQLTPIAPAGPGFAVPALVFQIHFLETTNLGSATECNNTYGVPGVTLCEDIFVVDAAGAGFNPADGSLNQTFTLGGNAYNAKIFVAGLSQLNNKECSVAGAGAGCIGFITQEDKANSFNVSLQITDKPFTVPEPASLALLGLALTGLAVARRRA